MNRSNDRSTKIPLPEWIIAGLGLALVLVTFGYLAQRAYREQSPPSFNAHIEKTVATGGLIYATVVVQNTGGTPVAQLRLLAGFGDESDARVVTIDYLPSHSERRVGFCLEPRTR